MHINKIYDYKSTAAKYDWGEVGGKLMGSFKTTKNETIKGAPYELFIWFELSSKIKGSVTITSIELYDTKKNVIVFESNEAKKSKFDVNSSGIQNAYFSFKDLALSYVRYKLTLKFKIETNKFVVEDDATLYFDTDYKEYRSNRLWDRLMGV